MKKYIGCSPEGFLAQELLSPCSWGAPPSRCASVRQPPDLCPFGFL